MIADDHQIIIDGIKLMLEDSENIKVVAETNTSEDIISKIAMQPVDIIILDINMQPLNGLDITPKILKKYPHIKIMYLTMNSDPKFIYKATKLGAYGYLLKNTGKAEFIEAIQNVAKSIPYYNDEVRESLEKYTPSENEVNIKNITKRELEILKYVAQGLTSQQIADILLITGKTVETHRSNLMHKLNVRNTIELVKIATAENLI